MKTTQSARPNGRKTNPQTKAPVSQSPGEVRRLYPTVRGCLRGLAVLEAVSTLRFAQSRDVVAATGLPRATVIRLLETLEEGRYVARGDDGVYEIAPRAALLAGGFNYDAWLVGVTTPILLKLLQQIGWPSDVMVLRGDTMVVRNSNRSYSPLDINRQYVGMQSPIAESASGRAYLAWCDETERQRLLQLGTRVSAQKRTLQELQRTRDRGYAVRDPHLRPAVGAIAIPILANGRLQCILDCVYLPQAITERAIVEHCLPAMKEAGASIAQEFEDHFASRS